MIDPFFELRKLADELPRNLDSSGRAMVCAGHDRQWLDAGVPDEEGFIGNPKMEKRLALAMEIVAEVCRLKDEGVL